MTELKDPKVDLKKALFVFGGTKAGLARVLGLNRTTVTDWVSGRKQYVPPLHAYRLLRHYPDSIYEEKNNAE